MESVSACLDEGLDEWLLKRTQAQFDFVKQEERVLVVNRHEGLIIEFLGPIQRSQYVPR